MTHLWDVLSRGICGTFPLYSLYGVVGLVVLFLCAPGLAAAQDARALRLIVVADRQTAQNILQQLQQGASFSALAHAKSIGPEYEL